MPYARIAGKRNTARGLALSELAERQHGVVSYAQLLRLGMSSSGVGRAADAGRLQRIFHGAYAVGHKGIGEKGRLMAAVLACGPGAVISHRSAGALLGLLDEGPAVIDVIAPPERGRKIDGIHFHRVRPPRLEERGTADGIPCTSPARTLVDLAGTVSTWTLRSCFERAAKGRILDVPAIDAALDPRRRGAR
ncbi:MAG TPA: type IV toxin-antitoxin system AbiEi family antitoxin domain-containing protein, partial [Solirubrobacterales bacterium]|nr:type IV toxin-antitoxin system AbiEi family antitoxin domain-containing protein [Solirubrobacterales bacterium]